MPVASLSCWQAKWFVTFSVSYYVGNARWYTFSAGLPSGRPGIMIALYTSSVKIRPSQPTDSLLELIAICNALSCVKSGGLSSLNLRAHRTEAWHPSTKDMEFVDSMCTEFVSIFMSPALVWKTFAVQTFLEPCLMISEAQRYSFFSRDAKHSTWLQRKPLIAISLLDSSSIRLQHVEHAWNYCRE